MVVVLNKGGGRQTLIKGLPDGRYIPCKTKLSVSEANSFSAANQPGKELPPVDVADSMPAAIMLSTQSTLTLTAEPQ